jgi:hypothetical protein
MAENARMQKLLFLDYGFVQGTRVFSGWFRRNKMTSLTNKQLIDTLKLVQPSRVFPNKYYYTSAPYCPSSEAVVKGPFEPAVPPLQLFNIRPITVVPFRRMNATFSAANNFLELGRLCLLAMEKATHVQLSRKMYN